LLPTGRPRDVIAGVEASCVDATNPLVFVHARDVGLTAAETPQAVDANADVMARLEKIRVEAAMRMGLPPSASAPKIAFVAAPREYAALDGVRHAATDYDVLARAISMGNCHRAFPLTSAMCLTVAARIEGTVVHEVATKAAHDVRLGHASGVLPLDAEVTTRYSS